MQDMEVTRPSCNQLTACQSHPSFQIVTHQSQPWSAHGRPFKNVSLLTHISAVTAAHIADAGELAAATFLLVTGFALDCSCLSEGSLW